jgi:single-strand DNA-binding protein
MLNTITIMGRICNDLELKATNTGTEVVSFTVACERDFRDKNGEKQTDFIDVVAFKNTAQFVSKFFSKGRMAIVNGQLQTRIWEDKDGNKRKSVEIVANNVYFGDSKQSEGDAVPKVASTQEFVAVEVDGDLPF